MINIPKIVNELKQEFDNLNNMFSFATKESAKYNTMLETYIGGTIHERYGLEVYDQYENWKLDSR